MNAVLVENICKSFGDVRAVDGLSVQIPAGSIYGFLGPNGAGKTTTLRMIMNIICPDSGRIEIFGNSSVERGKWQIGYMPEERGLYRKMSVSKVLGYFGAIKGVGAVELSRRIPMWLERMGLGEYANKKVEELSRGMHQKLQFAVTVINSPQLLILDEPFSGLDPLNLDLLKEIIIEMRDEGKTIIFSTHVMHEAEKLCDRILLINKGRSVIDGELSQIRSDRKSHTISVRVDGDTDFVAGLPMVSHVEFGDGELEISLSEDGDPQELLKVLVGRLDVHSFEVKEPCLHEIFVSLVGGVDAQDP